MSYFKHYIKTFKLKSFITITNEPYYIEWFCFHVKIIVNTISRKR